MYNRTYEFCEIKSSNFEFLVMFGTLKEYTRFNYTHTVLCLSFRLFHTDICISQTLLSKHNF